MKSLHRRSFILSFCVAIALAGCGESVSPEILALRQKFLATTAPTGEIPVSEARKQFNDGKFTDSTTFAIRARINAGDTPPFANGRAEFMVTDATGHDGDESHNPHECPFCSRDIKSMLTWVEFQDESGKPIAIDARELFELKEFDLLVVEGSGRVNEEDILVMTASRMFVKR